MAEQEKYLRHCFLSFSSYGYPWTERKEALMRERASTMSSDSIVGGVYCFSYRADILDKGRDFPMEVYVACSSNGEIGGFGTSVSNAEYRSPTIVKEFGEFTRRDEDFEW